MIIETRSMFYKISYLSVAIRRCHTLLPRANLNFQRWEDIRGFAFILHSLHISAGDGGIGTWVRRFPAKLNIDY